MHIPPAPHLGMFTISFFVATHPARDVVDFSIRSRPSTPLAKVLQSSLLSWQGDLRQRSWGNIWETWETYAKTWENMMKILKNIGHIWENMGTYGNTLWNIHGKLLETWDMGTKMMDTKGEMIYGKTHWQILSGKYGNTHGHKREPIWKIWLRQLGWWHS